MTSFLIILIFSIAYAVKGGQLNHVKPLKYFADFNFLTRRLMDGKILSALMILITCSLTNNFFHGFLMMIAWLVSVSPSIGEEAGAVGRIGYWWGDYRDKGFTRSYGIKKAIQRGIMMGSVWTVATGYIPFILVMAIGFPLAHFLMQEIYYRIYKKDDWVWAEPVIGSMLGICYSLSQLINQEICYA